MQKNVCSKNNHLCANRPTSEARAGAGTTAEGEHRLLGSPGLGEPSRNTGQCG